MHEPKLAETDILFYYVFLADLETELQTQNRRWFNHYKNGFKIKKQPRSLIYRLSRVGTPGAGGPDE